MRALQPASNFIRHVVALLILVPTVCQAVTIRGVPSCGDWVENRALNNVLGVANEFWLLGYLSGLAVGSNRDFIKGTDNPSLFLWVDNFCRASPLKDVADAGSQLLRELTRQKGK